MDSRQNNQTIKNKKQILSLSMIVLFLIVFLSTISFGQASNDVDPELSGMKKNVAPVKVDGNVLFNISGTTSYPAEQRAATISKRIINVSSNSSILPDSVKVIAGEEHLKIYAGEEFIMNVYKIDAETEGRSQALFAGYIQHKIGAAIKLYRHDRSRPVLIKKSLYALGAAVLLAVILIIIFWLIRRGNLALQNQIKSRIDRVENISHKLISSNQLWKAFHSLLKALKILATIVIVVIFLEYVLGLFPWTNNFAISVLNVILTPLLAIGKGFLNFLPNLVFLVILFLFTRYFLRLIKLLFIGVQQGGIVIKDFEPEWSIPTFKILRLFIIAFAVIFAYPYIPGSDSNAFKGVSVFLGVLFSLGSSSFIGNVIAGYSMTYRRAFKKGDRIQVNEHVGYVMEQELMVTRMRTIKNVEIVIPNSVLLNSNLINYSTKAKELGLILHTTVGIGYETAWRQVDAMLKLAADRTEGILKQPQPFVLKKSLGDFAVNYEINVYCDNATGINNIYNLLHQNILDVFNENKVQIMTPAYEGDPATPKIVPKEQWVTPLASEGK